MSASGSEDRRPADLQQDDLLPPAWAMHGVSYRSPDSSSLLLQQMETTIPRGATTAVLGPNGAGKSTLLRLLCGLIQPTTGMIQTGGEDLELLSRTDRARRIAYVPQALGTRFDFTVAELVATGRHARRRRADRWSENDQAACAEALEACGLDALTHRLLPSLSGGELQRALIARCLAAQADLLVLDEPTSSLDVDHTLEILHLLQDLATESRTVLLSMHDLDLAARFADSVLVLDGGRLVAQGACPSTLTPEVIREVFRVEPTWLAAPAGEQVLHLAREPGTRSRGHHRPKR